MKDRPAEGAELSNGYGRLIRRIADHHIPHRRIAVRLCGEGAELLRGQHELERRQAQIEGVGSGGGRSDDRAFRSRRCGRLALRQREHAHATEQAEPRKLDEPARPVAETRVTRESHAREDTRPGTARPVRKWALWTPKASNAERAVQLIDIGANLTHDSFDSDRAQVLARAAAAGVAQLVVTAADFQSTHQAIGLARAHPALLFATAGVHPHHASELDLGRMAELERLACAPEVVAIGECGLDYFRDFSPREAQRRAFERQLELATRVGKPVFLHQRDAHADFLAILREHRPRLAGAVAHCFTGTGLELAAYLELDLAIGLTGWICDERRGTHLVELAREIPAEHLMIETDAPYLLPRDLLPRPKSRRNEPMHLVHIARTIANARDVSLDELAASTTRNACRFFALPTPPAAALSHRCETKRA